MNLYEEERTQELIQRLVALAAPTRWSIIAAASLLSGGLMALLAGVFFPEGICPWLFGGLGLLLGYSAGTLVAAQFVTLLETLAQLLVAASAILASMDARTPTEE